MIDKMPQYASTLTKLRIGETVRSIARQSNLFHLRPTRVTMDLTERCQLRCPTCLRWNTPPEAQKDELLTEGWKTVLVKLKQWLGEFPFILSGGEPLLREDIFEIIPFAVYKGLQPSLITNGCGFSSVSNKIVESGLKSLRVSINGYNPHTHDTTRGVEGAFVKTVKFIKDVNLLRKKSNSKMKLSIVMVLMPSNCEEAVKMVRWVKEEGIDNVIFKPIEPPDYFHPYFKEQHIAKEVDQKWYSENITGHSRKLGSVIDELLVLKKKGYPISNSLTHLQWMNKYFKDPYDVLNLNCKVGSRNLEIDPYGNLRICHNMKPIGNILTGSPDQIYYNKESKEQRKLIRNCDMMCARARYWNTR